MKIAVSSDARTHLVDAILEDLGKRGHEVEYFGPEAGEEVDWPVVTLEAAGFFSEGRLFLPNKPAERILIPTSAESQ